MATPRIRFKRSIPALISVVLSLCALRCFGQSDARPLPDFSYTQGWLGADDAYSVLV